MNQQTMTNYSELYKNILSKYCIEIQKLHSKQEELNKREDKYSQSKRTQLKYSNYYHNNKKEQRILKRKKKKQ